MNNSLENEIIFVKKGFELIKKTGWDKFSIKKMSKTLKIPNDELKKIFSCKNSIINKFSIMIDNNVETMVSVNDFKDSSTKDILFELNGSLLELALSLRNNLSHQFSHHRNIIFHIFFVHH